MIKNRSKYKKQLNGLNKISNLLGSKKKKSKGSSIKNVILAIAIAFIFSFFIGYTIQLFYPEPEYSDYCDERLGLKPSIVDTEKACLLNGGIWTDTSVENTDVDLQCVKVNTNDDSRNIRLNCQEFNIERGYCEYENNCSSGYNNARENYDKKYFIISLIIGIIVFVASAIMQLVSVSAGLMVGSILTMIVGTMRYWRYSSDILRVVILGLVLGILIWLGYKKLNK